jgi:hypothetical protein
VGIFSLERFPTFLVVTIFTKENNDQVNEEKKHDAIGERYCFGEKTSKGAISIRN